MTQASSTGSRLRALRERLGWSQLALARESGLPRPEISAIETGRNLASSWRVRSFLAQSMGLSLEPLSKYLDGNVSLEDVVKLLPAEHRKQKPGRRGPGRPKNPPVAAGLPGSLRKAADLVSDDSGFDRPVVYELAERLARTERDAPDRTVLQWAALLQEAATKLRSELRVNPMRIPELATAIGLYVKDDPTCGPAVRTVAAEIVAAKPDARHLSAIQWIRLLEPALSARAARAEKRAPVAARRKSRT